MALKKEPVPFNIRFTLGDYVELEVTIENTFGTVA
jgi:hypothetical protein